MFEITATLDHALTDNLTVRVEGRYDWAKDNSSSDNFFTTARPAAGGGFPRLHPAGPGDGPRRAPVSLLALG